MKYYAHSLKDKPQSEWQTLEEHSANVARLAETFALQFKSFDYVRNAAFLHDLGKADDRFQGYLLRENGLDDSNYDSGHINHSSAGASFAEEKFSPCAGRIIAYLIAGHHAGLPDWYSCETGASALSVRLNEGKENLKHIKSYVIEAEKDLTKKMIRPEFARKQEYVHLWIRMLFSCLVDADFLDTEKFMSSEVYEQRTVAGFAPFEELMRSFDIHMNKLIESVPDTIVNAVRKEVFTACRATAQKPSGIFSLTVPTGGGKTLSGMAFALGHTVNHKKSRIIYVIPYTSIIEQTATIFRGIFGNENVIEHHSNLDPEKETPRSRLASENWDAPVIVTTNVQFFESLYAAKPSRCRKLHNIVNSVVILDEAQLLPPQLLTPCVDIMNQLVRNYGVTMVLSTATQPALPNLDKPIEIIPPEMKLFERLKRTNFNIPFDLNTPGNWQSIAEQLMQHKQVLCVVNTRRDCYDLFRLMLEGTIHLSALMCGEHRSKVISNIKQRLKDGFPVRVVSTQLVESGVDIDFPVVFRALCGLDSINQAAGRCNREGKLCDEGKLGEVHIFIPPKPTPRGLLRKGEDKTRELLSLGVDFFQSDAIKRYFNLFYAAVNDTGSRFYDWLVKDINPKVNIQFRTAAAEFKLIDDHAQRPVFVRYGDSEKWIKQIRAIGPTRENMRRLQRYTVNLSKYSFDKVRTEGLLEDLWKSEYWRWSPKYDEVIGLNIFGNGWSPEDLMQ